MNLPNLITVFRILLIPVLVILLLYSHFSWALGVFALAAVSDGLDGLIARLSNQQTRLGTYLDPMADKLLLISGFMTLSLLQVIPAWIAIVLVSRDLILIFGTMMLHMIHGRFEITPSWLGKCTTATQLFYVLAILVLMTMNKDNSVLQPVLFLTVFLTIVSGLHYIFRAIRMQNNHII
jgi:cardiolipin synthase (CMP-forming)